MITQDKLKQALNYNELTGVFNWRDSRRRIKKGDVAGSDNGSGYLRIQVDGKSYKAHRLAWLYVYGYFPENEIDHKNRVRYDNRIKNLRESSRQCNMRNKTIAKNNTSGVTGVRYNRKTHMWHGKITVNYKAIYLGQFWGMEEAVMARWKAEKKYNFHECCTNSSAYNYLKKHKLI